MFWTPLSKTRISSLVLLFNPEDGGNAFLRNIGNYHLIGHNIPEDSKLHQHRWKIPMTPSGISPATFRFAAQYLNHCANTCPPVMITGLDYYSSWKLVVVKLALTLHWGIVIQSDKKVCVHLTIIIQRVTNNVQSVLRQSSDIYWHAELCSRRPCSVKHGPHSECVLW
jgi:hypothetical protein